eukprot:g8433.t1
MDQLATETPTWIPGFCREFSVCWFHEVAAGDVTVGFLHIDLPQDPGLDQSFLAVCDLARLFAGLAGRTLAATQSLETVDRDLSTWVDIGLSDPDEDDWLTALQSLLAAVRQVTGFQSAAFFLLDPEADALQLRAAEGVRQYQIPRPYRELPASAPDLQSVTQEPVLVSAKSAGGAEWLPDGSSIGYCVAVRSNGVPLGTLWTYDRRGRIPDDRECHILESLAARIGTVLERVVLLKESELQHRQQHDLNVASECQQRDILRGLPKSNGFDAAAVCTSRYELGGDLCELIPLDESRTLIAIGDASGDSVPAAMVMSAVHGALRALSGFDGSDRPLGIEEMMERINAALHDITPSHQFMSLLFGILDTRDLTFQYTNAGHPAPIVLRGAQVQTLESHGMLLGILPDSPYRKSTLQLEQGDVLIAFSDGISEAMNSRRTMFRPDGIAAAVAPPGERTAGELLDAVWNGLESHIAGASDGDDRTLLVLRIPDRIEAHLANGTAAGTLRPGV